MGDHRITRFVRVAGRRVDGPLVVQKILGGRASDPGATARDQYRLLHVPPLEALVSKSQWCHSHSGLRETGGPPIESEGISRRGRHVDHPYVISK